MMSMRVTQSMMNQTMLNNLNKSFQTMDKLQNQLSSGKKITRPSDDPVSAVRGMFYRSNMMEIDQFKRSAEDGTDWMDTTDQALGEVTDVMQRVRELTVQAANGTNDKSSLDAIGAEISQLREHLGEVANTTFGDRYIFAGTETKTPPVQDVDGKKEFINTNDQQVVREVGQGSFIKINVNGKDIFPGMLNVLNKISSDLTDGKSPGENLDELSAQIDNVLKERSKLGAQMNRMDLTVSRLDKIQISTEKMMSDAEDADIAKVITDLTAQENVHRAALSAGARIIQPTLVDFLR